MNYIILLVICICCSITTLFQKHFQTKFTGVHYFTAVCALFAAFFFAAATRDWHLTFPIFGYATLFAGSYFFATVFAIKAMQHGPLAHTALVISFSLLIPTFYGILFLKEPIGITFVIGLILVIITLILTGKPVKTENAVKLSLLWTVLVAIAFIGNGMCSVSQRLGQEQTGNINLLMTVALIEVVILNLICGLLKEDKTKFLAACKNGLVYSAGAGIANGTTNLLVTVLNKRMSASIMFPVIGALGLFISFLASIFFYKEKFSRTQLVGFGLSIVSVIILNL